MQLFAFFDETSKEHEAIINFQMATETESYMTRFNRKWGVGWLYR